MIRKWSYLKDKSTTKPNGIDIKSFNDFCNFDKRHTFKVFRTTTRFKRYSTGLSTVVRLKTYKITRKTEKLTLACFINLWARAYMRCRQFYRYYQAIGLFNTVMPTFSPDAVKVILLKSNPVTNIFYFSCSNNVMSKYLTSNLSDWKIKSPIKNSRNSYVASTGLNDLKDFDQVGSTSVFIDEKFYLPEEIQKVSKNQLQTWSSFNNVLFNNSLILLKIIRQLFIKLILYSFYRRI